MEAGCPGSTNDLFEKAKLAVRNVLDPEVPVLSIEEMGILQRIDLRDGIVIVTITPTYVGCPAMHAIRADIGSSLDYVGVERYRIDVAYSPAWTTDWLSQTAREKLKSYGISPPKKKKELEDLSGIKGVGIECPLCKSVATTLVSEIGSTACKSLYKCSNCLEPFEYFKCL